MANKSAEDRLTAPKVRLADSSLSGPKNKVVAVLEVFESASASERLERARQFLAAVPSATEVAIVGNSREAADDLIRKLALTVPATLGLHRFSATQIAVRFATPDLARLGLAPTTALATEAVAARVVFEATRRGVAHWLKWQTAAVQWTQEAPGRTRVQLSLLAKLPPLLFIDLAAPAAYD